MSHADLHVVINAANPQNEMSVEQVERLFLLKAKRFDNGDFVVPVDQPEGAKARIIFIKKILNKDENQLKYYWSRKVFSGGDRPPPVEKSDADVESYVATRKGGIGYMTQVPKNERVKVVLTIKE